MHARAVPGRVRRGRKANNTSNVTLQEREKACDVDASLQQIVLDSTSSIKQFVLSSSLCSPCSCCRIRGKGLINGHSRLQYQFASRPVLYCSMFLGGTETLVYS